MDSREDGWRRAQGLWKFLRFASIYGPKRATIKALGRLRIGRWGIVRRGADLPTVGFIGCGQFALSTIAYFLRGRACLMGCFDVDASAARSFARIHGVERVASTADDLIADGRVKFIYIASNHASHTDYAVAALAAGRDVYVEKPVAVTRAQLARLHAAVYRPGRRIAAGYNRPHSSAMGDLRRHIGKPSGRLTLSCFVSGHVIPQDHWYRDPGEGTRICGNLGHWLDLAVHMLCWRELPDRWQIAVVWSDDSGRDDNVAIVLTSEVGDLVSIVLSSRSEPFEGINESINVQWDDVIAKIDDFRRQTIWKGSRLVRYRYWPKDVGHHKAVLQLLEGAGRDWAEIEDSTLLMLHITDMVREARSMSEFSFSAARQALAAAESGNR